MQFNGEKSWKNSSLDFRAIVGRNKAFADE